MNITQERREKKKLNYDWSIWFTEGFGKTLYYGEVLNISSDSLSLICKADKNLPQQGCQVTACFNVPYTDRDDSSEVIMLFRQGCVHRVYTEDNEVSRQIAIKFEKPLPFKHRETNRVHLRFDAQQREGNSFHSQLTLVESTN